MGSVTITAGVQNGGYNIAAGTATFTATMNWGDGGTSSVSVSPDNPSAALTHSYTVPGTYQVTLSASGQLEDGTPCSDTVSIATATVIQPPPPGFPTGPLSPPVTFCPVPAPQPTAVRAQEAAAPAPAPPCEPTHALTPEEKRSLQLSLQKDASKGIIACAGAAFLTGPFLPIFEGLCVAYALETSGDFIQASLLDPPDRHYWAPVTLPAAPSTPRAALAAARPRGALKRLAAAQQSVVSLSQTLTVTLNRFNTAFAQHLVAAAGLQYAVAKTISGVLAQAMVNEAGAERAAASVLTRSGGLPGTLTAAQVQTEKTRLANLSGVPAPVITALGNDGLSTAQIQSAIAGAVAQVPAAPLNFHSLLGNPPSTGGLLAAYRSMTFADVALIVASLHLNHHISTARENRLLADLRRGATSRGGQRSAAVRQLLADAVPARSTLLEAAAAALRFSR